MNNKLILSDHELDLPNKSELIDAFLNAGEYVSSNNPDYGKKYYNSRIDINKLVNMTRQLYKMQEKEFKYYLEHKDLYKNYSRLLRLYELTCQLLGKNISELSDRELINLGSETDSPILDTKVSKKPELIKKIAKDFRDFLSICYIQSSDYDFINEHNIPDFIHMMTNRIRISFNQSEMRIYLNLKPENVVDFSRYLFNYSKKEGMLPYFKFSSVYRSDELIIYCKKEELTKYLDILTNIKKDHPNLCKLADKVDINLAKYDNWIGVGEEVEDSLRGEESFTSIRENAVYEFLCRIRTKFNKEYKYNYLRIENHLKGDDPRVIKVFDEVLLEYGIDPKTYILNLNSRYKNNSNRK